MAGPAMDSGNVDPDETRARSGWQIAQEIWRGSGIRWDEPAGAPGPDSSAPPGHAEQALAAGLSRPREFPGAQAFFGAPTMAEAPPQAQDPVIPGTPIATSEASERFMAFQESVREASAYKGASPPDPPHGGLAQPPIPPAAAGGRDRRGPRGGASGAIRAVVPAAVIVGVGAGAFLMLTGQASQMVNDLPGSQPGPVHGAAAHPAAGPKSSGSGERSAIWRGGPRGTWSIVSGGRPAVFSVPSGSLASVTAAGTGFVAVGTHAGHAAVWVTRNGLSWTPLNLALPGGAVSAALRFTAASGSTVVAAGDAETGHGSIPFVAMSRDGGQKWQQVDLPAPRGTKVTALTSSGPGFTAAGKTGVRTVHWTSADGVTWSVAS